MQKKSSLVNAVIFLLAIPFCALGGFFLFGAEKYYIPCAAITVLSLVPFFITFERKNTSAREIGVIASLTAVAVISRAAFYALPQIKPIAAVIIIGAVSFGGEVGFLTGALSMLLSNMLFGHGVWTPFQMLGLGVVGFLCGLLFYTSKYKQNRFVLSISGGFITFLFYGAVVDTSAVLMLATGANLKAALAVYAAGVPMNAVLGVTTAVLVFFFGNLFISKLDRLRIKYNIFNRRKQ